MTDDANKDKLNITGPWSLLGYYMKAHGNLTFGVFTMILMWVFMVTPELERNQVTIDAHRKLIEELNALSRDHQQTSEHLHTTAEILDRVTARQMGQ